MSVQVENLEKNTAKLTIEVPAEKFEEAVQHSYNKNKGKFNIPGFRKGKAPFNMIKKMYGVGVFYEDAVDEVIDASYPDAAKESGLEIVSRPSISIEEIEEGKAFVYTAVVAVKPEVTLGEYKGVEVQKTKSEVTEEDIETEIKRAREKNSRLITVEDRGIEDGDQVTIDFDGSVDGKRFEGGKAEDYPLTIGSHTFIDNFEEQLIGKTTGEECEVNVTFPAEYHVEELKNKPAVFKVKVKEIQRKELPEANDDFASEVSDFDTMEEFEFVFDIALAPEFKAEVSAKDKVDYYSIEVSEEMIDNQVKMYTQRTGKYDKVDAYEDNDMLKGLLAQLDEEGNTKEGGIQVEAAVLMPAYMKNDDQKAIFANAKVNDVLVFNPNVAYDGHAAELGSLLKIDKEIAKDVKSDFSFQVEEITRFVPGELTQEVFDQAFGEGVVKTEEEFRAKIKEEIAARFVADSDYKFLIDIRKVMMEKVGKLEFSDALLKRIMLLNNEEKGEEYVAENYDKSIEELTWHLIKEQLVEANEIKVEQEDVLKMARETTKAQFAQYGMLSIPDDVLDNYAQEMLKKKETINNLVSRVVEVKLAAALKAQVTLENKNVSIEEFNKMFE
mgnify:FL=1